VSKGVVLLTGASGLVGTWLRRTAPADVELVSLVHETPVPGQATAATADLRDAAAVAEVVSAVRPSLIVHAAMAMDAPSIVDATSNVRRAAALVGADVLYVSTDAVFSGDGRRRDERSRPDPIWDYGRWKAEAERLVLQGGSSSAIVRLPLVISLDPEDGAVARIREAMRNRLTTSWFHDELRQPAMGADIADGLWRIAMLGRDRRSGTWHLPGPERLSRYDIARRVADALHVDPSSVLSVPAPRDGARPLHLDLGDDRARSEIAWDPRPILR
jgi:dTDP-4-dehydrorhamnose reductase